MNTFVGKRFRLNWSYLVLFLAALLMTARAFSAPQLSLEEYQAQVQAQSPGYQSAQQAQEAARLRIDEGSRVVAPTFFASFQTISDARMLYPLFFQYDHREDQMYLAGIQQPTRFGLNAKLTYDWVASQLVEPKTPGNFDRTYLGRAKLELSQSLWANGFGSTTRANERFVNAQAEAQGYGSQARLEQIRFEDEMTYYRKAYSQKALLIQASALSQSKAILDWAARRSHRNLGEDADRLQAQAAYEQRLIQVEMAKNEDYQASLHFNERRGKPGAEVNETLQEAPMSFPPASTQRLSLAETKASEAQVKAAQANRVLQDEKLRPSLDVTGSYATNSYRTDTGAAFRDSLTTNHPTWSVGVYFSTPLDFSAVSRSRTASQIELASAEASHQQKIRDEAERLSSLRVGIDSAKKRFDLARSYVKTSEQKLTVERKRLRTGQTTTYQVLLFEQDLASAQLEQARVEYELRRLSAESKLFKESL